MDNLYNFVYRGTLAEQALDKAGRQTLRTSSLARADIARTLGIESLDDRFVEEATNMSIAYVAIAAFENGVRDLVSGLMLENHGANWWSKVPTSIRDGAKKRMEDEQKVRWHTQRGLDPINYTTLGNLAAIIRNNWECFEAHIHSHEWASGIFEVVERSRNVIMHSGSLETEDVERLGVYIRDWIKQVGV